MALTAWPCSKLLLMRPWQLPALQTPPQHHNSLHQIDTNRAKLFPTAGLLPPKERDKRTFKNIIYPTYLCEPNVISTLLL